MGKLFLAVGHNGLRMTSSDGRTWSAPQLGKEGEVYRAAAVGNGRLVAVGTFGGDQVLASSKNDGMWTVSKRPGGYGGYLRSLTFVNGRFLALGGDPGAVGVAAPYLLSSADGEKWEESKFGGKFMLRRLAFGNGVYVGVGDRGRRSSSADAKTWTDVPNTKPLETLIDVAFGAGVFVGVGLHGLRMSTTDGAKWSEKQLGEEGEHLNSIVWAKDRFLAVGAGVTMTSADGRKWERHDNRDAPLTMAWHDGVFVGSRWKGRLMRSTDGIAWEETAKREHHAEAIAGGEVG
jgi:hypothetical protein